MVEIRGSVKGVSALRYYDFTYRRLIDKPSETSEMSPADESMTSELLEVPLVDYVVKIGRTSLMGMSSVELWLCPNGLTMARIPEKVLEFRASNAFVLRHLCEEIAVHRVFGVLPDTPPNRG